MTSAPFLTVDDEPISTKQVFQYLQTSGGLNNFLGGVVRQHVLEKELGAIPMTDADDAAVNDTIINFRMQNELKTQEDFNAWLQNNALDSATFRQRIVSGLRLEKLKGEIVAPQVQTYFTDRKAFLDRVVLSRIVIADESQAKDIREQIAGGASFEIMAREYSIGNDRMMNGMMGAVSIGSLPETIRPQVEESSAGAVLGPIAQDDNLWVLLRVEQVLPADFADPQLQQTIRNEIFEAWLSEKLQKLKIQVQLGDEV
jgi:parvulin-like peptidyl-prolyl isomerase